MPIVVYEFRFPCHVHGETQGMPEVIQRFGFKAAWLMQGPPETDLARLAYAAIPTAV